MHMAKLSGPQVSTENPIFGRFSSLSLSRPFQTTQSFTPGCRISRSICGPGASGNSTIHITSACSVRLKILKTNMLFSSQIFHPCALGFAGRTSWLRRVLKGTRTTRTGSSESAVFRFISCSCTFPCKIWISSIPCRWNTCCEVHYHVGKLTRRMFLICAGAWGKHDVPPDE